MKTKEIAAALLALFLSSTSMVSFHGVWTGKAESVESQVDSAFAFGSSVNMNNGTMENIEGAGPLHEPIASAGPETKTVIEGELIALDVYTETERDFEPEPVTKIGAGPNMECDAYKIDEEVTLYANLTYGGDPLQSRLVSFQVQGPQGTEDYVRSAYTNATGIAAVSFRLKTVAGDPEYCFGKWLVTSTTYVQSQVITDTILFDAGWIVELLNVTTVKEISGVWTPTSTFKKGDDLGVFFDLQNIALHNKNVTLTIVVYDEGNVPIMRKVIRETEATGRYCNPKGATVKVLPVGTIPKWAYIGQGKVYVTVLPVNGGGPVKSDDFRILDAY